MFLSFFIWCKVGNYFCNHQIKSHLFLDKMYFYCFLCLFTPIFAQIFRIFFPMSDVFVSFASSVVLKNSSKEDPFNPSNPMWTYSRYSLQFNIEQFNMRPWRTIQHSTFNTQHSSCRPGRSSDLLPRLSWWALRCLLSSRTASSYKQKNTWLWSNVNEQIINTK